MPPSPDNKAAFLRQQRRLSSATKAAFSGKEGGDFTRHDKWLCMMYPRPMRLRKLLSEDGAIFISIYWNFPNE